MLFSLLAGAFLVVAVIGGYTYLNYKSKGKDVRLSIDESEQLIKNAQREEMRFSGRIDEETIKYKAKIDLINSLIYRKSFSWIDFLADLENSLPDSCYIVSLAPNLKGDSKMEVRFRVASPNLNALLNFYNKLDSKKFKDIRIRSESRTDSGFLLAEISSIYERTY